MKTPKEIAKEWATDYKPFEEDLRPQQYAEYGFEQGYKRGVNDLFKLIGELLTAMNI